MRVRALIVAVTLLLVPAGTAVAQTDAVGPIVNGDFESFSAPDEATAPLEGTPADECIGIGHQANYGSDTPQHKLVEEQDPVAAVDLVAEDPDGEAQRQAGYGHCVFSDEEGHDAYWINPTEAGGTTDEDAAFWSVGTQASAGFDFDDDPFDKEIQIESNPNNGGDHNLWQNMFHPGREYSFTANFDALEFDLESGSIADDAFVQISLGAEPLNVQEPYAAVFIDCAITFPGQYLQGSLTGGTVSASPVADGVKYDGGTDIDCPPEDDDFDWSSASEEERREVLGRLSIVQVSFWNFNDGTEDVVLDNIALPGATTHAEEAADGNVRLCTDLDDGPVDETTCNDSTVGKE